MLSLVTINSEPNQANRDNNIYLNTNGIHLDIVIPKNIIDDSLLDGIKHKPTDQYLSFGWGDENFYLNTPTWADLTLANAFSALFLKSSTLMHVTRYQQKQTDWIEVKVNDEELKILNTYLLNSFALNHNGTKNILNGQGYSSFDDFYAAQGSYSCFYTCNTWANSGFKTCGLKACLWTPFDFGLMNKYRR